MQTIIAIMFMIGVTLTGCAWATKDLLNTEKVENCEKAKTVLTEIETYVYQACSKKPQTEQGLSESKTWRQQDVEK